MHKKVHIMLFENILMYLEGEDCMNDFIVKKREKKDYEQFTCRIEVDLLNRIREIVINNNLDSINCFINECLRFSLDNIKIEKM